MRSPVLPTIEKFCANAWVTLAFVLATIAWSAFAGKDFNWDQLNYHFYAGYALLNDRLTQDFMPANGQSYLNPLPYLPFYLMVTHGWPSLLVASVLAGIQSLNAVVAYHITRRTLPVDCMYTGTLSCLAALLSILSPVFLTEAGTTFADLSTSAFVLGAVLLSLNASTRRARWAPFFAGALLAAAGGLKLSNLMFGPACAAMLLAVAPTRQQRLRAVCLLAAGSVVGMAAAQGYWGWKLWKEFHNPFFPFFGDLFPTDSFPKEGAPMERFMPHGVLDYILLPFRMASTRAWIYIENAAPDLRFAALLIIALCGTGITVTQYQKRGLEIRRRFTRQSIGLWTFFAIAYVTWETISGNGRYGITVLILCGPVLVVTATAVFANERHAVYAALTIAALQLVHLSSGDLRWSTGPWTESWYGIQVPERLRREAFLYISAGHNSNSFIYPFLSPRSAFTNPLGQISFDLTGPGSSRLRTLFQRYRGRTRMLAMDIETEDSNSRAQWMEGMNEYVSRLGYQIDAGDCETIVANGITHESGQDFDASKPRARRLKSCALVEHPFARAAERARITSVAKQIVAWCPKLFKPAYTVVERGLGNWTVSYGSTDSSLLFRDDGKIFGVFTRATADILLGTVEQWEKGFRPSCAAQPDIPRETLNFE